MRTFKDETIDFQEKRCPEMESLLKRLLQWRKELGQKTIPDRQRLDEAVPLLEQYGLERDFVLFTVAICEWWFRVRRPSRNHIKRSLTAKLNEETYTPYNDWFSKPVRAERVPEIVDRYVDVRLQSYWDRQRHETSRLDNLDRIPTLIERFTQPFRIADFQPLPPQKGGYPWQACWTASTIVYERLREKYTKRTDSAPLEGALLLANALLDRLVDDAQFRRTKRKVLEDSPELTKWFIGRFNNMRTARRETVHQLLDENYSMLTAFSLPS